MKKKILSVVATASVCVGLVATAYATNPVKILFNGEILETDSQPQIINERTYVPIRAIADMFGADIVWDGENKAVVIDAPNATADEQRIKGLERALAPQSSLEALHSWATGVKDRNGALQYAVMAPELQEKHYNEMVLSNWSTGVSSPWAEQYQIEKIYDTDDDITTYKVLFTYTDSTRNTNIIEKHVTIGKNDGTWHVSAIEDVDARGEIQQLVVDDNGKTTGIYVESDQEQTNATYDKATFMITDTTKIYKGYTSELLTADHLKEGVNVQAAYHGPVLKIYPVQGGADIIRVFE